MIANALFPQLAADTFHMVPLLAYAGDWRQQLRPTLFIGNSSPQRSAGDIHAVTNTALAERPSYLQPRRSVSDLAHINDMNAFASNSVSSLDTSEYLLFPGFENIILPDGYWCFSQHIPSADAQYPEYDYLWLNYWFDRTGVVYFKQNGRFFPKNWHYNIALFNWRGHLPRTLLGGEGEQILGGANPYFVPPIPQSSAYHQALTVQTSSPPVAGYGTAQLLGLPAEIRQLIFDFALDIKNRLTALPAIARATNRVTIPKLLEVNRQIRAETAKRLFHRRQIDFTERFNGRYDPNPAIAIAKRVPHLKHMRFGVQIKKDGHCAIHKERVVGVALCVHQLGGVLRRFTIETLDTCDCPDHEDTWLKGPFHGSLKKFHGALEQVVLDNDWPSRLPEVEAYEWPGFYRGAPRPLSFCGRIYWSQEEELVEWMPPSGRVKEVSQERGEAQGQGAEG